MNLTLERKYLKENYTIGKLYIDGQFFCDTLEDTVRTTKIYGKTAIPYGTYKINMDTVSPKFKDRAWAKPYGGKLPRLLNVPNYEGVLIHVGNTAEDTLGCILVGRNLVKGKLVQSTDIFNKLMSKLTNCKESISITIK